MRRHSLIALLIGAFAATGVAAQEPDTAAAGDAAAAYTVGRCIVQSNRPAAARLMQALPIGGDGAGPEAMRIMGEVGCGAESLRSDQALMLRGGLAQALFQADFEHFGVEPRNPRAMIDLGLPAETDPASDGNRDLYRWSDCVVRNDTENVQRLLRTPVASRQEAQVLGALVPYMHACARPMARLVVDASELRSLFVQSSYQAMYRYWSGALREANAVTESRGDQIVCRRNPETASRVNHTRICLSRNEWIKLENGTRDGMLEFLRRATQGVGR
ncbi:MAG: hypothetical protein ACK4K7_04110 [Allosphingosinicella sp.]|uniref:hypothetical protein n=1 Tax=Allosphingosinicella sp. TaxID=2823234 RepID=UPI00392FBD0B